MTSRALLLVALVAMAAAVGCSGKGKSPTGPSGPGSARLVSVPGSATAATIIGGTTVTQYTPATFDNLAAGVFAATLTLTGYADTTVLLTVPAGGTLEATIPMRPLAGTPTSITEIWQGVFDFPGPLAVSPTGNFYVTASKNFIDMFVVVAPNGAILHQTPIPDVDAAPAVDIALDSHDNAYVIGRYSSSGIIVFNASGAFTRTISRRLMGSEGILGIALGPGDTIHVATRYAGAAVVEKYTTAGAFLYAFPIGTPFPGPIEVATDGTIYVGAGPDEDTPQIRKFGPTGTLIQTWTMTARPEAIMRGPAGKIYVSSLWGGGVPSDTHQVPSRMEILSSAGVRLAAWAIENQSLAYLDRHAVDTDGTIYLPLRNDRRVLRYSID